MMTVSAKPAFDSSKFLALVHQMETREAAFLRAIPDIVVAYDSTGKCHFFYPGSGTQWPFSINDLTGRYLAESDAAQRLTEAGRRGKRSSGEFTLSSTQISFRPWSICTRPGG